MSEAPAGTPLQEPGAVAVDHAAARAFVADPGHGVVDVFTTTGAFVTQFGEGILGAEALAVDEASGDVYVAESGGSVVEVFKPNGAGGFDLLSEWEGVRTPAGEFSGIAGLAVDNSTSASSGDVYVVNSGTGVVNVLKPNAGAEEASEGESVRVLSGAKLEEPNAVAVSAAAGSPGVVYVADSVKGAVYVFSAAGIFERKIAGTGSPQGSFRGAFGEEGNVTAVAVDGVSGDLLVAEAERRVVSEFNETGEYVGWIVTTPSGTFGEPRGVAVNPGGDLYVADTGSHVVDLFGAGVIVPDAKTDPPTTLARTTATLNGSINGDGKPDRYYFQWGTSEALGSTTPATAGDGGEEKATATVGELHAGTTYFCRLVAENEDGANYGTIREFTTAPAVRALSTGPATKVGPSGATLTGTLTPGGFDTHYYFEWGTTSEYGSISPALPGTDVGAGAEPVTASAELAGLAANVTYHYRLVADNEFGTTYGEDAKFTTPGPPRITNEATVGIGHETATIKAQVDPDQLATKYYFEYGETTSYGTELPVGGASIPPGEALVAVSAVLNNLRPGATYHFRVVASNEAGTTTTADQVFTTVAPALIDSESVAEVTATAATLQTQINPLGRETTYYFQYGTVSCKANPGSCTSVPAPPGIDIGSGESDIPGTIQLQELRPASTYYYRVLATNTLGTAEGPERTFTTQPAATPVSLPDGRAWELVSPPNKRGAPIEALTREGGWIRAAENGDALTYVADGAITEEAQGDRSPEMQQVVAVRTPEGWTSQDIATPNARATGVNPGSAPEYQFFTPDLLQSLVAPAGSEPALAAGVIRPTPYLRNDATGTYLPLLTEADVAPGSELGGRIEFVGATADLSHVMLHSNVALTGRGSGPGLYEWTGGTLQYASMLPGGSVPSEVAFGYSHMAADALSSDGSRIIWTNSVENPGHLYMRDTTSRETIQLDKAQGVAEPEDSSARFQAASSDGRKVFFTDKQQLTKDSTAEPASGEGKPDLYECETVEAEGKLACQLKDLTVDHNPGGHAGVQGLLFGTSEDGATIYLVAQGVLAANENGIGEKAEGGQYNLYVLHFGGAEWATTFIAKLSPEDIPEWGGGRVGDSAYLTARVSPSGRYLAFMSAGSPTGYDNIDRNSGKRDEEVYLYDSSDASLRCVSCNPTGARPVAVLDTVESGEGLGLLVDRRKVWAEPGHEHWLAGNVPGWTAQSDVSALVQSRYLSDDGRLFFNSPDNLVPQASNGKENVYEYEPSGLGSCESASGGCVSLISSGSSDKESAFLEATPSGNDVFFLTAAQLSPQDTDTAFDVYDARVCSASSPCLGSRAQAPAGCTTTVECRPASPPQQAPVGPAGSAAFSGSGNVAPPRAPTSVAKTVKPKPLTRAQRLARALEACRKLKAKKKRVACERKARRAFDAKAKRASRHATRRRGKR